MGRVRNLLRDRIQIRLRQKKEPDPWIRIRNWKPEATTNYLGIIIPDLINIAADSLIDIPIIIQI